MKIGKAVEGIFSTAVALDQSGGLRNTIFVIDNEVYIMNYDHTVLLRFMLRGDLKEAPFQHPIAFRANDYDSASFTEEDGKIVFSNAQNGFLRKKTCATSDMTPEEAREVFNRYWDDEDRQFFELPKDVLSLLERDLSHLEFVADAGEPMKIVQRNIYSGAVIEVQKIRNAFMKEASEDAFGPVAVKTGDFFALYSFPKEYGDVFGFAFPSKDEDYILVKTWDKSKRDMKGIIACCIYDEVIELREARKNGRKK